MPQRPVAKGSSRPVKTTPATVAVNVAPLYRRIDWLAFGLTTLLVFIGYFITLAPDLTLEDAGELAVASHYAGVPHPPGYPVWTVITWLFTVLVPVSGIAWRVALASAVAGALACGLLAMVVSRGSSMMIEGIPFLKNIERRKESALCVVAGLVAGLLMGFNGYMWSQAVIVEVYTLSVLSLMGVICFLLRWLYAPQQRLYLYGAFFFFGICLTNHMSLLVAAMGIQVAVAAVNHRLGRDLFLGNTVIYVLVLILSATDRVGLFKTSTPLFVIFNAIGIGSVIGCVWLTIKTGALGNQFHRVALMGLAWVLGASFYFYMPIASMTNPPMNWGYPRTAEGFMHALKRGQYESVSPTSNVIDFVRQTAMYTDGAMEEFTLVYLLVGLLPFVFFRFMQNRERAWIIGLAAIYVFLAFLLLILLNPGLDRQSKDLHKVFFTASHVVISIGIGYGVALMGAYLLVQYETARRWALIGAAIAVALALFTLVGGIEKTFGDMEQSGIGLFAYGIKAAVVDGQNIWPAYSALLLLVLTLAFLAVVFVCRDRIRFGAMLAIFALMPAPMIMLHWEENEQRGHRFGYWFGHDMFTPPFDVYPEMSRDAILFGGTDPGRFNPTYMIFSESFTPPQKKHNPEFDRRDVYLITQNALADGTYLDYIRAHYNRSAQVDPPFFTNFFRTRALSFLDTIFMGIGDRVEKRRRVGESYFTAEDFPEMESLAGRLREPKDNISRFLHGQLTEKTRGLLGDGSGSALKKALAVDLNGVLEQEPIYTPERFEGIEITERTRRFVAENPQGHTRIRLNRLLIEEAYPEVARSPGGLYPDLEIHTPSGQDSAKAFETYMLDAQRRFQLDQLRPGETFHVDPRTGQVRISGQTAVMSLNAILTRVIFDKNPDHEFYIEESFPLDWMYPYLSPFGIIMKINREPLPEITPEMMAKDHEFWRSYSTRLIGDWITYDTPVEQIAEFAEKVYRRRDYRGFEGDRKFIRDDNAQKAFSKLRSSIGGIYSWRLGAEVPEAYQQKTPEHHQLLLREAEFALKQAFAFCPYSPEAVFRYVQVLLTMGRLEDAKIVVSTALKFDSLNQALVNLDQQLKAVIAGSGGQPSGAESLFASAANLIQAGRHDQALELLDRLLADPSVDPASVLAVAQAYIQLNDAPRLEKALLRLVALVPDNAEAWYDLAGHQASLGKPQEALRSLRQAIRLSNERLRTNPSERNLIDQARKDGRFVALQQHPEFKRLMQQ